MKSKICIMIISIVMVGCTNKEVKVSGSKTVSDLENEQKKYEEVKNRKTSNLKQRIINFDEGSAKNLENMGTTVTVPTD